MRVIFGFLAVLMPVFLAQPALAQCINRGGAVTCAPDTSRPKYPNATQRPKDEPETNGQTIILGPSASNDRNAWIVTPLEADGARVLGGTNAAGCGPGMGC